MTLLRDLRLAFAERSARRELRRLMENVGRPGLWAAAQEPGLAAVVDQHAAAVRDIVREGLRRAGGGGVATLVPVTSAGGTLRLAAYARSLMAEQRRSGVTIVLPQNGTWRPDDWTTLRLIAVCQLSRG